MQSYFRLLPFYVELVSPPPSLRFSRFHGERRSLGSVGSVCRPLGRSDGRSFGRSVGSVGRVGRSDGPSDRSVGSVSRAAGSIFEHL